MLRVRRIYFMSKQFYLLLMFLLCCTNVFSENDTLIFKLKNFETTNERKVGILRLTFEEAVTEEYWKYNPNDKKEFSKINIDDSDWKKINSNVKEEEDRKIFKGFGWFRLKLKIDPALTNVPIAIKMEQLGASEIYFDGDLLKSYGVVSKDAKIEEGINSGGLPIDIFIKDTLVHIIAVRYSNLNYKRYYEKYEEDFAGFSMTLANFNDAVDTSLMIQNAVIILSIGMFGFLFALGVVHMLMFYNDRSKKFNLYHSLFVLSFGLLLLLPAVYFSVPWTKIAIPLGYYSVYLVPVFLVSIMGLLNTLFNARLFTKWFVVNLIFALSFGICYSLKYSGYSGFSITVLILSVYFGSISISIKALRRKHQAAKTVAWGVLFFTIYFILSIIAIIYVATHDALNGNPLYFLIPLMLFLLSLLSLPLSVTIYLAKDFAKTSQQLRVELQNVEELSNKNLEQEIERKRILENQNILLEQQVRERTEEILTQKEEIEAQRDEVESINKIIENKNHEITDSINYALHIQKAILPDLEEIKEELHDSFILYKPKDIVSGDFYFFKKLEQDKFIIIAADCTGHGVPGAFMSLLATDILNELAVIDKSPSEILAHLNKGIKTKLKQYGNSTSRDGLDLALVLIDKERSLITYAGANRPLYIARAKENIIEEFKSTKAAIGGITEDTQEYDECMLHLEENDVFYISSDGYADQFGGEKGKKMMTRRFKEKLLELYTLPLSDQNLLLDEFYENWKANFEQIDDVLVIGVKL